MRDPRPPGSQVTKEIPTRVFSAAASGEAGGVWGKKMQEGRSGGEPLQVGIGWGESLLAFLQEISCKARGGSRDTSAISRRDGKGCT